jgi:hypothetical protein
MRITKPSGKRDATGHIEKSRQLRGWVALRQVSSLKLFFEPLPPGFSITQVLGV